MSFRLRYQNAFETYYSAATANFDAYMVAKKQAFEEWFNALSENLTIGTTLVRYQNSVTVGTEGTSSTSEVNIGITQYAVGDILLVHVGGVLLEENTEFIVSGAGSTAKIILTNPLEGVNRLTFVCIKSVVGNNEIYN